MKDHCQHRFRGVPVVHWQDVPSVHLLRIQKWNSSSDTSDKLSSSFRIWYICSLELYYLSDVWRVDNRRSCMIMPKARSRLSLAVVIDECVVVTYEGALSCKLFCISWSLSENDILLRGRYFITVRYCSFSFPDPCSLEESGKQRNEEI